MKHQRQWETILFQSIKVVPESLSHCPTFKMGFRVEATEHKSLGDIHTNCCDSDIQAKCTADRGHSLPTTFL